MGKNDQYDEVRLSDEQYDAIYSAGYAECLRDMITNLNNMKNIIESNEIDPMYYLEELIKTAKTTLNEDSTSINWGIIWQE